MERVLTGRRFTEGPVWVDADAVIAGVAGPGLIFSDLHDDTIWLLRGGVLSVFRSPSYGANGNAVTADGRLVTCEHGTRSVTITGVSSPSTRTLIERYGDKRLNSPNDVVVRSDGSIFFTDPPYGVGAKERELAFQGVYRHDPDGTTTLIADDLVKPNGLALVEQGDAIYVADTEQGAVFVVDGDASAPRGSRLVREVPRPDGLALHPDGRLFVAALHGVVALGPRHREESWPMLERPANLALDSDACNLYVCARTSIYRLPIGC